LNERYQYIVIDTNNFVYRSLYTTIKEENKDKYSDQELLELFGRIQLSFIQRINQFIFDFGYKESSEVFFIFDNPTSAYQIRKLISNGEYKHERFKKGTPPEVKFALNTLNEFLFYYSDKYRILRSKSLEADDLTNVIKNYKKPNHQNKMLFISADLDWSRNIDENCHWFNYKWDYENKCHKIYDIDRFRNEQGFTPKGNSVQLYKTFMGDSSDAIKKPCRIDMKRRSDYNSTILYICNNYTDLESIFKNMWVDPNIDNYFCKKFKEYEREIKINYRLVDFFEPEENVLDDLIVCKESVSLLRLKFNEFCMPLESRLVEKKIEVKETGFLKKNNYC